MVYPLEGIHDTETVYQTSYERTIGFVLPLGGRRLVCFVEVTSIDLWSWNRFRRAMTDHESAELGEVTIFRRIGNCTRILRKLKCLLYAETKLDYIRCLMRRSI